MNKNFVFVDRNQPLLLPPDLRDWVGEDDVVHFIIAAAEGVDLSVFRVNERGTGSSQYPPHMMLALLIYCYANGVFSSRRIERATYRDVAVRYLTADTHPDHDTIATFRRNNFEAVSACFVKVLELAQATGLLKVGTVSVDGTKLRADASINKNVGYERAGLLIEQLELEVAELMKQAQAADNSEPVDGQRLPEELAHREALKDKLAAARAQIEARAKAKADAERKEYERKLKERAQSKSPKGPEPKAPQDTPDPKAQHNLTDADSRLMRKNLRSGFEQSYNAQAVVDADGSQLILAARVTNQPSDVNELAPDIEAIPKSLGLPTHILADAGYLNQQHTAPLEDIGIDLYIATGRDTQRRKHDFRPQQTPQEPKYQIRSPWILAMKEKLQTDEGKARYKKRKQTVEPVFGTIKDAIGLRRFHLRGLERVNGEWLLTALAYNLKRLHNLAGGKLPGQIALSKTHPTTRQPGQRPQRAKARLLAIPIVTIVQTILSGKHQACELSPTGC